MSSSTDLPLQSDCYLVKRPDTAGCLHVIPRNSAVRVRLHDTTVSPTATFLRSPLNVNVLGVQGNA